jgi:hypothetical protein
MALRPFSGSVRATQPSEHQVVNVHSKLPPVSASETLKARLHAVFDSQIPNYGDYNLVAGSNSIAARGPAGGNQRPRRRRTFVVGYRWHPAEVVIAPFNEETLTAGSVPVTINMTNLAYAVQLPGGGYEVAASTGKAFRFEVADVMTLEAPELPAIDRSAAGDGAERSGVEQQIEQTDDARDFREFMADFVQRGLPFLPADPA